MENQYPAGWSMIPGSSPTASNQENLYLQQQQQQQQYQLQQQHQQQQFQLQQQQNLFMQQQRLQYQQSPPQQQIQLPQKQLQSPPQHQKPQQTLASHFQLQHLVETLADTIEIGVRDHHSDALVADVNSHFEKCQNLLNSIASATGSKNMTVEGQKLKLQESEHLLNQRRELIANFRNSIEELIKTDP